jgi:hypothetical protein
MANQLSSVPIVLDTDLPSFMAVQTLRPGQKWNMNISKMALEANGATSSGSVTVTDPVSGRFILAPMLIPAGDASEFIVFLDDISSPIPATDICVTGLTATGTKLYLWYRD